MRSLEFLFGAVELVGADYMGELIEVRGDFYSANLLKNGLLYVGEAR